MKSPKLPTPRFEHGGYSTNWTPYPQSGPDVQVHRGCLFERSCALYQVALAINEALFQEDNLERLIPAEPEVEILFGRLKEWHTALPECMRPRRGHIPHIVTIQ